MARIDPLTELAFEIERFEWTAADRLELSGRWLGVRGQRFVRPTLHLRVDGRRRRLIAVLDHKPWAPDTDELWTAAFAWRGERGTVTGARLEVSTEIALDLPAPGDELPAAPLTPRPRPQRAPRRPPASRREEPPREPAAAEAEEPPRDAAAQPPAPVAAEEQPPAAAVEPPPPAAAEPAPDDAPADPPAHAASPVTAEIAALALERRLFEERAEREVLARDLADARERIEALTSHHESSVARAQEIVDLEGQLAVANARADAAQAHVSRLERELERVTSAGIAPLPPRTPGREAEPGTNVAAIVAVAVAVLVVLVILVSIL